MLVCVFQIMPLLRVVRGHLANAPEVKPQGEAINAEF